MARVVGKVRPTTEGSTSMKLSEMIIIGLLVAVLVFGGYYYWQSRQKATFALGQFLSAMNSGRTKDEYELLDDEDKTLLPSVSAYTKSNEVPLALGYTERIPRFSMDKELPDSKDPNVVSIPTTLTVLAQSSGKELYQTAAGKEYKDTFKMRKDKEGHWKVWLSETFRAAQGKLHLMESPPSPQSTY